MNLCYYLVNIERQTSEENLDVAKVVKTATSRPDKRVRRSESLRRIEIEEALTKRMERNQAKAIKLMMKEMHQENQNLRLETENPSAVLPGVPF